MNNSTDNNARVAIVTGASRGIGRAVAERLGADGLRVVVNFAGNAAAAAETVALIERAGGAAVACQADVGTPEGVAGMYEAALKAFGRVDVVVSNAGVMPTVPIADDSLAAFDKTIATNLRGTFLVMAAAARHLGSGGRFVALSSSVLAKNFPGYGPYIASKAGVEGLVHVFANELRGRGITVNAVVAPGPVGTELFLAGKTPEQIAQSAALSPLQRLGEPTDIAAAVSFLAGPDGGWINSQVIRANGGFA